MNKQLATVLAATFTTALLLSGCGKSAVNAPAAQLLATRAAAAKAVAQPGFGKRLVLDKATDAISPGDSMRHQTFCLEGTSDGKPFSLSATTFFPYYIPMFGTISVNGRDVKLTKENAVALDDLVHQADVSSLDDKGHEALRGFLYGLDFSAGHPGG